MLRHAPADPTLRRTARRAHGVGFGLAVAVAIAACGDEPGGRTGPPIDPPPEEDLNARLARQLELRGFTGRIEQTLLGRLGRAIDQDLSEVGRLLFFDPVLSLTGDNSCAGCHGPNMGFNDSRPIAVGVGNNGVVGPGRTGPHNLRRSPSVINAAFYPRLMWDGRFESLSLDPFDNSAGFAFPEPEGASLSHMQHLLGAQAFTPVVAREEMAGFDFVGDNDAMRAEVASRVDQVAEFRTRFADVFPDVAAGAPIAYEHIGAALSEFMLTLVRADAPIDRFARGDTTALTEEQKRGGLLFMNIRASCTECHIFAGFANEMFSDFEAHVLAVPQVAPHETIAQYDGPGQNEDFGLERHTGDPADRYKFRTSPLRNVAFQPSFMHNGAFLCMEDAIRHHVDVYESLERYSPDALGMATRTSGPDAPMLERLHHLSRTPRDLTDEEIRLITTFVEHALADPDAHPSALAALVPGSVPSGLPVHDFDFDVPPRICN
jgi:cytochrome c peroxidase